MITINNLALREKVYAILVLIVFISFLFSYAINSISIGLLCLLIFVDKKNNIVFKLKAIKNNKLIVLYILFFFAQIVGLIYTEDIKTGLEKIVKFIPIVFLPLLINTEKISKTTFLKIINILKYTIIGFFCVTLIYHCFITGKSLLTYVTAFINLKLNISQFYLASILVIPIFFIVKEIENKVHVVANIVQGCFLLFCIIILQNKTTFIVLIFSLFYKLYTLYKRDKIKLNKTFFITIFFTIVSLCAVLLTSNLKNKFEVLFKTTDFNIKTIITKNKVTHTKNTFEQRLLIDYIVIKEIIHFLPFGVGTGDYLNILYDEYDKIGFKEGILHKLNVHNQYLTEFFKTGLIGGIIFLILTFYLFKHSSINDTFYIYVVLFFCIGCFFESYLERQHGIIIFSFILPLTLKYEKIK